MNNENKPNREIGRSRHTGSTVQINIMMLQAVACSALIWWLWPSSMSHFVNGFLILLLGMAVFGFVVGSIVRIARIYRIDKEIWELEKSATESRQADFASGEKRDSVRQTEWKA